MNATAPREKFLSFICDEKYGLTIIFALLVVMLYFSWWKWGIISSCDNSRELIDVYFILKGLIPYKDFYYDYPPFVAYILAFFSRLCGYKLYVFYAFSIIIVFFYTLSMYILSRQVLNKTGATLSTCLFISQILFFNKGMYSYIFPYSYNAVVASFLYILMVLCCFLHLKTESSKYIIMAAISIFLCSLVKQDFLISLMMGFIFYIILYLIKLNGFQHLFSPVTIIQRLKELFVSLRLDVVFLLIIVFPVIVYALLGIYTGYGELFECLVPFKKYDSPSVNKFYSEFLWGYPTPKALIRFVKFALIDIMLYSGFLVVIYSLIAGFKKIQTYKKSILILSFIVILFMAGFFIFHVDKLSVELLLKAVDNSKFLYTGINFWFIILLMITLYNSRCNCNYKFIMLLGFSIIVSYRTVFGLDLARYSFYYLPVYLVAFVYFLYELLPEYLSKLKVVDVKIVKIAVISFLTILVMFYVYVTKAKYGIKTYEDKTYLGQVYFIEYHYNEYLLLKSISQFIKAHTTTKDKILALPNANLVYILSERLPASRYFLLIAGYATTKEEELSLMDEIKNNRPEIIALSNEAFLEGSFIQMYPDVYKYIVENYQVIKTFQNVYKGKTILSYNIYKLIKD